MVKVTKMSEMEIRIEALKLAIEHKNKNGSRYTLSFIARNFEHYIKTGDKFNDV